MGRHSEIMKPKLRKGLWSPEEDEKLFNYISRFGVGSWSTVSKLAGLERCGKSCRLRWMNYLRPHLKRGMFSQQEEDLIISLHEALGNRWAQIAAKLPGRTDNEIKNFWNSYLKKKLTRQGIDPNTHKPISEKDDRKGKISVEKSPLVLPRTKLVNHVDVSPNWSSTEQVFELRKTQVVPTISSEMEQEFQGANANYYYEVGGGREASSEKFGSKPIFDTQFPYEFQESFDPNGYNLNIVPHYNQNHLNGNLNFGYASGLTLSHFSDSSSSRISSFSFNEVKESSRNSSNLIILENDGTFSCGDGKFEEKPSLWPEGQFGHNSEAFSSYQLMSLSENMDFSSKYYL